MVLSLLGRRGKLHDMLKSVGHLIPSRAQSHYNMLIRDIEYGERWLAISEKGLPYVSWGTVETRNDDSRRLRTRMGKYMGKHLGIPDYTIGDIVSTVTEFYSFEPGKMHVVSGKEVTAAYRRGAGCTSCMTGSDCDKVEVYEINQDKVSLLIYGDDEARALLWTSDDGEYKMVDRPYPESERCRTIFQEWAILNGAEYRKWNEQHELTVTLPNSDKMPYMDTLMYGTRKGNTVYLSENDGDHLLNSTCGGPWGGVQCDCCGDVIDSYDSCTTPEGEVYCVDCFHDNYCYCAHCDEATSNDCATYVDCVGNVCEYCFDEHYIICNHCHCIVYNDDTVACSYCSEECARDDGMVCCAECGEWEKEHASIEVDGDYFCSYGCAKDYGNVLCNSCKEWNEACTCQEEIDDEEDKTDERQDCHVDCGLLCQNQRGTDATHDVSHL